MKEIYKCNIVHVIIYGTTRPWVTKVILNTVMLEVSPYLVGMGWGFLNREMVLAINRWEPHETQNLRTAKAIIRQRDSLLKGTKSLLATCLTED